MLWVEQEKAGRLFLEAIRFQDSMCSKVREMVIRETARKSPIRTRSHFLDSTRQGLILEGKQRRVLMALWEGVVDRRVRMVLSRLVADDRLPSRCGEAW